MLEGYKTYSVVVVALVYAVVGVYGGYIDGTTAAQVVLAALGAAGLRNAIK